MEKNDLAQEGIRKVQRCLLTVSEIRVNSFMRLNILRLLGRSPITRSVLFNTNTTGVHM